MAIITFKDLQGKEQSVDFDGKFNVAFNCDCETIMQSMPDKCIDLLCADPRMVTALHRVHSLVM